MAATSFYLADQLGWAHDEGHPAGTFHTFDRLDVGARSGPRKVHVMLPRAYDRQRRYPVVWMHDGDTAFWPDGVTRKTWDVAGALSAASDGDAASLREVIVVAAHPLDRDRELTHADWEHGRRPWGGLSGWTEYLAEDLRLFLARHYAMSEDPREHAVVGSSHGGLAAFWVATRRPDRFGLAGCFSPSFFVGLDSLEHGASATPLAEAPLITEVAALLADPSRRPRLFLSWGLERHGGPHNAVVEALAGLRAEQLAQLLTGTWGYSEQVLERGERPLPGRELYVLIDRLGGHDEQAWGHHFGLMMQAFFAAP